MILSPTEVIQATGRIPTTVIEFRIKMYVLLEELQEGNQDNLRMIEHSAMVMTFLNLLTSRKDKNIEDKAMQLTSAWMQYCNEVDTENENNEFVIEPTNFITAMLVKLLLHLDKKIDQFKDKQLEEAMKTTKRFYREYGLKGLT